MATSAEFRDLDDAALLERLVEAKKDLFTLRFHLATGQAENTARVRMVKRDIARINTLLREREIAAHEAMEVRS